MHRAHKIKLKPNAAQTVALKKAVGCARFAYNWALGTWQKQYADFLEGKAESPDVYKISRRWTNERPEWSRETTATAAQRAILNVGKAYQNFWNRKSRLPVFKKKGKCNDSFHVPNTHFGVHGKRALLPKIGSVKMTEELRFQGKIMAGHVSYKAGSWFLSVDVEVQDVALSTSSSIVGVDVGIKNIAVASDGTVLENPKLLKAYEDRIKRAQQRLSRTERASKRHDKALLKLQKVHAKITNVRDDAIHKFTTCLSKNHGTAVVETLSVVEMQEKGTKWLCCLLADTAMKEVHRKLEYKMRTLKAPKFYPSSKMCSKCGHVKDTLSLSERVYKCDACDHVQDRDDNASCNLKNMGWVTAPANTVAQATVNVEQVLGFA